MVSVLEKMMKQQDVVFHSLYFVDEYNILCYHINGLFLCMVCHAVKFFVPDMLFRKQHLGECLLSINRKTSKIKRRFLVSFFCCPKTKCEVFKKTGREEM